MKTFIIIYAIIHTNVKRKTDQVTVYTLDLNDLKPMQQNSSFLWVHIAGSEGTQLSLAH